MSNLLLEAKTIRALTDISEARTQMHITHESQTDPQHLPNPSFHWVMQEKPLSLLHSIAEHFHRDAVYFATRFDVLWENGQLMHKMGRTKSFVDLLMACECSLKSHALLSLQDLPPAEAYREVRSCGHNIHRLAKLAAYLPDRAAYQHLGAELAQLPVHIRYSLEAYETFFPAFVDRKYADQNYSETIGNNPWVVRVRGSLGVLVDGIANELSGAIPMDLELLLQHEHELREFAKTCLK
ncbi:MAG: hypothetical protein V5B44_11585 [Candidatus Accumulibacter necessarius]|uniref:hypothetical protein n=1 Tax=Candidatus Accumulibacter necessarius TaxID=2954386 RepID=UPI002FC322F1